MKTIDSTTIPMYVYSREDIRTNTSDGADHNVLTSDLEQSKEESTNIPCNVPSSATTSTMSANHIHQYIHKKHDNNIKLQQKKRLSMLHKYISENQTYQKNTNHALTEGTAIGYGDELTLTDTWTTGEKNDYFRIGTININGISKTLDWIEWEILLCHMNTLQIDALGVSEPNINFKKKTVMLRLYESMKSHDHHMQLSTSCSNQLLHSEKKMGGTMMLLDG
jgi:hypothetical protein